MTTIKASEVLSPAVLAEHANLRHEAQLQSANDRLQGMIEKLSLAEKESSLQQQLQVAAAASSATIEGVALGADARGPKEWSWSSSYQQWSNWQDLDELREDKQREEERVKELESRPNYMGHQHDHGIERKMFELPEEEKMAFCERHRALGNVLYEEGLLPKAAEQYQLALSYYEYCFPASSAEQEHLDTLRHACLCNISLSYYRMGHLREAVEAASLVLRQDERNTKALFRRAQAYRALDEYAQATQDLNAARELLPKDKLILQEITKLHKQKACSTKSEQHMAASMLGVTSPSSTSSSSGYVGDASSKSNIAEWCEQEENILSIFFDTIYPLEPRLFGNIKAPQAMCRVKLFFVRHGETTANRDDILQGQCDYPLTEAGERGATLVGMALKRRGLFSKTYASDLPRAFNTACLLVQEREDEAHRHKSLISQTPLLRELHFGVREMLPRGTSIEQAKEIVAAKQGVHVSKVVDNLESMESVYKRQTDFFALVVRDMQTAAAAAATSAAVNGERGGDDGVLNVLCVSHGGFIRSLFSRYETRVHAGRGEIEKIRNCSVSVMTLSFAMEAGAEAESVVSFEIRDVNMVHHLDEDKAQQGQVFAY